MKFIRTGLLGTALLAVALLSGCGEQPGAQTAPPQMPPTLVNVVAAKAQDVPVYLDEIGKKRRSNR